MRKVSKTNTKGLKSLDKYLNKDQKKMFKYVKKSTVMEFKLKETLTKYYKSTIDEDPILKQRLSNI